MASPKKGSSLGERERELVQVLLFKDLGNADIAIMSAVTRLSQLHQKCPTASMIMNELLTIYPLRSTQLYDRLSRLEELGFVSVDPFRRPRSYRLDLSTVLSGSKEWLRRQKQDLAKAYESLEDSLRTFEEMTPVDVARIVDAAVQKNDCHIT